MLRGIGMKVLMMMCFILILPQGAAISRECGIPVSRPAGIFRVDSFEALEELGRMVAQQEGEYTGEVWLVCDIEAARPMEPIGSGAHAFSGTFDGKGHVIAGLTIRGGGDFQGLFGYVGARGCVKDLTLRGVVSAGTRYTGGIAAYSAGTISGCRVEGGYIAGGGGLEYGAATGGIVGLSCGAVIDCRAIDTRVGGLRYVGGIVGSQCGGRIGGCLSAATVYSWYGGEALAGGVAGGIQTGGLIERCISAGEVCAAGAAWAGGVVGGVMSGQVKKCISYAEVDGREAGGTAGYASQRAQIVRCGYLGMDKGVGEGRQDGTERISFNRGQGRLLMTYHERRSSLK